MSANLQRGPDNLKSIDSHRHGGEQRHGGEHKTLINSGVEVTSENMRPDSLSANMTQVLPFDSLEALKPPKKS